MAGSADEAGLIVHFVGTFKDFFAEETRIGLPATSGPKALVLRLCEIQEVMSLQRRLETDGAWSKFEFGAENCRVIASRCLAWYRTDYPWEPLRLDLGRDHIVCGGVELQRSAVSLGFEPTLENARDAAEALGSTSVPSRSGLQLTEVEFETFLNWMKALATPE